MLLIALFFFLSPLTAFASATPSVKPEIITFKNGELTLKGELFKPVGNGPFPVVIYNHGSAPAMLNSQASAMIAPNFVENGWAFFMPYRRGQGLSEKAGPYIIDEIHSAEEKGGEAAAAATMVRILKNEHLSDQMAALSWLKSQKWVLKKRIAVAGNSFGGIETIFAVAHESFCAAIDASGGAESWAKAPELQKEMKDSAKKAIAPVFFFQAENDFDSTPSKVLAEEMKSVGKTAEVKIFPSFGTSPKDGHSFAYRGVKVWFPAVFGFIRQHCK